MITAYISYIIPIKKKGETTVRCNTCKKDFSHCPPFCSQCGGLNEIIKSEVDDVYTYGDFMNDHNDEFVDELLPSFGHRGREYLIPNHRLKYTRHGCGPITASDIIRDQQLALAEFTEHYAAVLSALSESFEDVTVEYGYILNEHDAYWSSGYPEDGEWEGVES